MKVNDRYYSGREVQKLLSITEPSLRNLVNQRKIRKIVPPGRQNGVYLKSEIDAFAEKWEAFLMAKEPPKTTFGISTADDMEAENELAKKTDIAGSGMTADVRQEWLKIVPECDYHVKNDNKIVAFLRMLPIKHDAIDAFMNREILERELSARYIEPLIKGKPTELFVIGITSDPDISEESRMHYVRVLLRGVRNELENLGCRGIIITKLYAKSSTPTGIAMATHMGMKEYAPRAGKLLKFVLDVETSNSFLIKCYKEGLKEWEKEQKMKIKKTTFSIERE